MSILKESDPIVVFNSVVPVMRSFVDHLRRLMPEDIKKEMGQHIEDTPSRLARMYVFQLLSGYQTTPREVLGTVFDDGYDEVVLVRDIEFYSLCAHHLLPFYGKAHVAYLPKGKVVGLSKLARLVECFARRLQIQEQMTAQIAQSVMEVLEPRAAACVIQAEHLCMGCRGVEKPGAITVTSTLLGEFREEPAARAELFSLINHGQSR